MEYLNGLPITNRRINRKLRSDRLKSARLIATHTIDEWYDMLDFFEWTCAICFTTEKITKDHIIPISLGGSDGIENLQPLCRSCNTGKNDNCDYRLQLSNYLSKKLPINYRTPLSYHGETIYGY